MTHAPLPDWAALSTTALASPIPDLELAKPWLVGSATPFWFSRSAWSLQAIARLRLRVTGRAAVRVWIPAYFCNESLRPLRNMGAQLEFYPLLPDGSADTAALRAMRDVAAPDVVVAVHYFGQPTDLDEFAQFAAESGAWLVEDAAHVLRPVGDIGRRGDFVLYSPHKLLPIPDGAVLVVRPTGPGEVSTQMIESHGLAELHAGMVTGAAVAPTAGLVWLAKRCVQKTGLRAARIAGPRFLDDERSSPSDPLIAPGMSTMAQKLLSALLAGLDAEGSVRARNCSEWRSRLLSGDIPSVGIVPLTAAFTPYLAGVALPSPVEAETLFDRLRGAAIPVVSWPDLPPEVIADPVRQRVAIAMRETRLFLPVHRSIASASIQPALVGALR